MRKCVSLLTVEDMKPSYSLAKLARENELSGHNRFRCKTIHDNGWCLGVECNLFPRGGFGGVQMNTAEVSSNELTPSVVGCASAQLTGTSVPVLPTNQVNPANTRGITKLGLEDPGISAEDKAYWGKLLNVKVREVIEHDVE